MLDAWFDMAGEGAVIDQGINELLSYTMNGNRALLAKAEKGSGNPVEITPRELEEEITRYDCGRSLDSTVGDRSDLLGMGAGSAKASWWGLRRVLRDQLEECLYQLDRLQQGEGDLYEASEAVRCLLDLDVYQYIYCVALLTRRSAVVLVKDKNISQENR